jgi:hypothetical protein
MPPQHHCGCQLNAALYHILRGNAGSIGWLSCALKVAFILCSFMKRTRTGLLRSPWCLRAGVCQCRLISTFEPAGLFLRNLVWTPRHCWTPQRHIFHYLKIVIHSNNMTNTRICEVRATLSPHAFGPEMVYGNRPWTNIQPLTIFLYTVK